MKDSQAQAVILTLQTYFPRFPIPEQTQYVWAAELARTSEGNPDVELYDFHTAMIAVANLARTWPDDHWPGLQAILAKIREVEQVTASPRLAEKTDPASIEEFNRILATFWEGRDADRIDTEVRLGVADEAEQLARSRERAAELLAAADPENKLPPMEARDRNVCSGAGQRGVMKDGRLVCPSCDEPLWPLVPVKS